MKTHLYALGRVVAGLCFGFLAGCGGGGYGGGGGSPRAATVWIPVDPMTISLGQSATITWTSNGTSCDASGAWDGVKAGDGSEMVTPSSVGMFTYSLTCTGGGYGESRTLSATLTVNPMSGFNQTDLVSGFAGTAAMTTDARLSNPRGLAFAPGAPALVMNSRAVTTYSGTGKRQSVAGMLGFSVTASTNGLDPTAIVANNSADFILTANGKAGSAAFIYAGRNGMI